MTQIKSRNWTKEEDDALIGIIDSLKNTEVLATWNQIADMLKQRNTGCRKTGKQCRERWANQLDPKIKRSQNWTTEENQTLFALHTNLGNKWSEISSHIAGRTDNCVKNHFYSTMRRGMRKMNSYIQNVKRKNTLTKTFKNQILNKILTLCEGKNDSKFQFNSTAKQLALSIKNQLVILSLNLSEIDQENQQFKQNLYQQISQFSRNCRKKKSKKNVDISSQEEENQVQKIQDQQYIKNDKVEIKNQVNIKQKNILSIQNLKQSHTQQVCQTKLIKVPILHVTDCKKIKDQQNFQPIKIIQGSKLLQQSANLNQFPFIYTTPNSSLPNFYQYCQNNQQIAQNWNNKNQHNQLNTMSFIQSIPNLNAINTNTSTNINKNIKNIITIENKDKKIQNGCIDFSSFASIPSSQINPQNIMKQKINNVFPQMIKSQQIQNNNNIYNNYGYFYQSQIQLPTQNHHQIQNITQDNNNIFTQLNQLNINSPQNTSLSITIPQINQNPQNLLSFSPFSLYNNSSNFNYYVNNWPIVQDQKYKSTKYQSQAQSQIQINQDKQKQKQKGSSLNNNNINIIKNKNIKLIQQQNQ